MNRCADRIRILRASGLLVAALCCADSCGITSELPKRDDAGRAPLLIQRYPDAPRAVKLRILDEATFLSAGDPKQLQDLIWQSIEHDQGDSDPLLWSRQARAITNLVNLEGKGAVFDLVKRLRARTKGDQRRFDSGRVVLLGSLGRLEFFARGAANSLRELVSKAPAGSTWKLSALAVLANLGDNDAPNQFDALLGQDHSDSASISELVQVLVLIRPLNWFTEKRLDSVMAKAKFVSNVEGLMAGKNLERRTQEGLDFQLYSAAILLGRSRENAKAYLPILEKVREWAVRNRHPAVVCFTIALMRIEVRGSGRQLLDLVDAIPQVEHGGALLQNIGDWFWQIDALADSPTIAVFTLLLKEEKIPRKTSLLLLTFCGLRAWEAVPVILELPNRESKHEPLAIELALRSIADTRQFEAIRQKGKDLNWDPSGEGVRRTLKFLETLKEK